MDVRCVQYFDGISTFEEIVYRTGLPRRELDHLLELYKADVSLLAFDCLTMCFERCANDTDYNIYTPMMKNRGPTLSLFVTGRQESTPWVC